MQKKSRSISYRGRQISVTATRAGVEQPATVQTVEIDGTPVAFEPDKIEPGDDLDDAIETGVRLAMRTVDY